jgi:Na+-transporting methylmalonyl-CoA/oxaloacetate decarboxylase gamma subunit
VTPDEPTEKFQPRSLFSTWIGVVLLFAFFGLLALVVIGASARGNSYEKKRAKVRAEKLEALNKEKLTAITTYGWVDKSKGIVRIPVEQAMMITVAELSQKTPTAANPIAAADLNPPPQSAAPATASPAPSAAPNASGTPKPTTISGPTSEAHNQPAAAINPPPAPPGTQPGPSHAPAASSPSPAAKPPGPASASPSPSARATPSPAHGKTP